MKSIPAKAKYFFKADMTQGYHQLLLDEDSQKKCSFLLQSGRYAYRVLPMGASPSSDIFSAVTDQMLEGIEGIKKEVDDILGWAETEEELADILRKVCERCRKWKAILSRRKLEGGPQIKFAGYVISEKGAHPDPDSVMGIRDFPKPKSVADIRSWLGLCTTFSPWYSGITEGNRHMRKMLLKDAVFIWSPEMEEEFQNMKIILTSDLIVKRFDPELETKLMVDGTRLSGMGYALVQYEESGKPRLVFCGSRRVSPTESRYSMTELELMAAWFAVEKCSYWLKGLDSFQILTDHKCLVDIEGHEIGETSDRLQRLMVRMMPYNFKFKYIQGKNHQFADALSRHPVSEAADGSDPIKEGERLMSIRAWTPDSEHGLETIYNETGRDESYTDAMVNFKLGKTRQQIKKLPVEAGARNFMHVWDRLGTM
ncbi:reverse transcriptase/ribonuclease H family protein, partial [Litorimonas sp.]|uniref:reverse transcriptase/ribonuclease H family protein n=1 Tax=Litorimonas sp. TaxID=1892381 RepID=UPI003A88C418